jgi:hypothetical protein
MIGKQLEYMYIIVASHKITWRKRGATDGAIADPKIEEFSRTQIRKGEYRYISISSSR